jgi:hypothetical protein
MTRPLLVAATMLAGFLAGTPVAKAAEEAASAGASRVRSNHPRIVALIAEATERSPTFRGLVETIEATDGIVYVQEGICRHGIRACLTGVTKPGAMRFLWIRVDTGKTDRELMASVGHELRHAVEVLSNRRVTSTGAMYLLYKREGLKTDSSAFETVAAVEAGRAVGLELAPR